MSPIPIGAWAAAGPATPRTGASARTTSRESETETMAILLWQAIRNRDEFARTPITRVSGMATRGGEP